MGRQMLKPVFVTKKERETIAEREALEKEEQEAMQREKVYLTPQRSFKPRGRVCTTVFDDRATELIWPP